MQIPEETMEEDNYIIFPPPGRSRAKFLIHEFERELMRLYFENAEMRRKLHELGVKELNFERKKTRAINFPFFKKKESIWESEMVRSMRFHEDIVWNLESCYDMKEELYFVISGGADGRCHVILEDEHFKKPIITYTGHRGSVNDVSYHRKSGLVCSSSGDGNCHLWKPDLSQFSQYLNEHNPFEMTRDRMYGSDDFSLDDEDTLDQDIESLNDDLDHENHFSKDIGERRPFPKDYSTFNLDKNLGVLLHNSVVQRSCWLGDDNSQKLKVLTVSWDNKIRKFDVERNQLEDSMDGLEYNRLVDVSYSGTKSGLVVTGGRSGVVRLWDIRDFRRPRMEIRCHDKGLNSCKFLGEHKRLLTGGEGGTCKMWDLNNLKSPVRSIHAKSEINDISVFDQQGGGDLMGGSSSSLLPSASSPTTKLFFCLSLTKPVATVHDGKTGKLMFKCKSSIAHNKMLTCCVLSKNSTGSGSNMTQRRNNFVFTSSIDQGIVQWKFKKANII